MFSWNGIDDNGRNSRDDVVVWIIQSDSRRIENGDAVASESSGLDLLFDFCPAEQRLSFSNGLRFKHLAEATSHGSLADGIGASQCQIS